MNYQKGERVWVRYCDGKGNTVFIITSPPDRHVYYLYTQEADGRWHRWGKDTSAGKLEQRYLSSLVS